MHPQRVGDMEQVTELHLGAGFHALDRRPVEAGVVGEAFLGEVEVQPPYPDAVACCSAGVDDPLGLVWHPPHALRIMVDSQQQICRIIRS